VSTLSTCSSRLLIGDIERWFNTTLVPLEFRSKHGLSGTMQITDHQTNHKVMDNENQGNFLIAFPPFSMCVPGVVFLNYLF
jgi:hypothetical protein